VKSVHRLLRNARYGLLLTVWLEAAVGGAFIALLATEFACASASASAAPHSKAQDKETDVVQRLASASIAT
jgi:hypothetical protein